MKVRWKLALFYGLLILVTGAALVAVSYQLVGHNLPRTTVTQASGDVVLLRAGKLSGDPNVTAADRASLRAVLSQPAGEVLTFLAKAQQTGLPPLSEQVVSSLTATLPVTVRNDALHQLLVQSLLALAALAVLSVAVGWVVAGRVLRPLRVITAAAAELSASSLDRRIGLRGPDDELSRLASTFDAMLDRLAAAFEGQRRFVAHASHELRTPLTVIATEVDVTLRRPDASVADLRAMAEIVRSGVDRSDRVLTSLLALARVENGLDVEEPVDLADIVREGLGRRAGDLSGGDLDVTVHLSPTCCLAEAGLLDRLVDNLLDNAVVHNVEGGWVQVSTRPVERQAELVVASSGATVDAADVPRLFTPFERLRGGDGAARHLGLGLSIVRAVVQAHGGSVTAAPVDGGGLRVVVRLPAGGSEAT
jgi:signal transduction histidine kinase